MSLGSLAVLGLEKLAMRERPFTLYLLQYSGSGCAASCRFCAQGRHARGSRAEWLSRVRWPARRLGEVLDALAEAGSPFSRICFQTVLKPGFVEEMLCVVEELASTGLPVSVTTTPVPRRVLEELRERGVEMLGVGLDAASPRVAAAVAKPYPWSRYVEFIRDGVGVFGEGRVYVHLVAGLGETPREMLDAMRLIYRLGARVALFRYTPLPGLPRLPGVSLQSYRAYQLARTLLEHGLDPENFLDFGGAEPRARPGASLPRRLVEEALLTSGCPGCNRPFYNEAPRGPIYNYPSRRILLEEAGSWRRQLEELGVSLDDED